MKINYVIAATLLLASCSPWEQEGIYTLYRGSLIGDDLRVHVATFDSMNGNGYNQENCRIAADLFQRQPSVAVRYWCEKGSYRK